MFEVPDPREAHRHAVFVRGLNPLVVLERTARLDDGCDPRLRGHVDPVPKGKEGIRTQGAPAGREEGLHPGDLHRVHAAHLSRADAYELVLRRIDNGVRLDVFDDAPGKIEGLVFGLRRGPLGDDLRLADGKLRYVAILDEEAAHDPPKIVARGTLAGDLRYFKNPDVLLYAQDLQRLRGKTRGDDHLEEGPYQLLRALPVHRAVQGHDAAESRNGIAGERLPEGLGHIALRCGCAAGIGMFDDNNRGQGEGAGDLPGGGAVPDVVVGEFLSLELACIGERRELRGILPVEGGPLVGVLPGA